MPTVTDKVRGYSDDLVIMFRSVMRTRVACLTAAEFDMVRNCVQNLRQLGCQSCITLWLSHQKIAKNNKAEKLTKEAVKASFIGPEPCCVVKTPKT
ncbi:hypothetical protein Trydic_g22570 [Trypoxylus dichotomus]